VQAINPSGQRLVALHIYRANPCPIPGRVKGASILIPYSLAQAKFASVCYGLKKKTEFNLFFLLSREIDKHHEATLTSQLGWHPGNPPSYARQTLKFNLKKRKIYTRRGETRSKPSKKKQKET